MLSWSAPISPTKVHVGDPLCSEKHCATSLARETHALSRKRSLCARIIVWHVVTIIIDFVLYTRQLRIGAVKTQQWFYYRYRALTGVFLKGLLPCIYHCDNVHTETALFWTAFVTASDHC